MFWVSQGCWRDGEARGVSMSVLGAVLLPPHLLRTAVEPALRSRLLAPGAPAVGGQMNGWLKGEKHAVLYRKINLAGWCDSAVIVPCKNTLAAYLRIMLY